MTSTTTSSVQCTMNNNKYNEGQVIGEELNCYTMQCLSGNVKLVKTDGCTPYCTSTRSLLQEIDYAQERQAYTNKNSCSANGINKWTNTNLEKVDADCIQIHCVGDGTVRAEFTLRLKPSCNCATTTTEPATTVPHCEEEVTTTEAPTITVSTTDLTACETEEPMTTL